MNSRVPEPVLSAEVGFCDIKLESVLRIRPLLRKERGDAVMLEPLETIVGPETVVLNPLHPSLTSPVTGGSLRNRADSDSTSINIPAHFHFNHVLPESTNQDKLYYTLGHPIASDTMRSLKNAVSGRSLGSKKSKAHLLVCIGVANSGKTFTCFGGSSIPKRRAAQDGLVPRLVDSLFSQSKHNSSGSSNGFAIQMSMIQVTQPISGKGSVELSSCQVHDLLAFAKTKTTDISPKTKNNMTVRNMAARFERAVPSPGGRKNPKENVEDFSTEIDAENPKPLIESVRDATQAREVLQNGLVASERLSRGNQNYHLCVTMQPVIDGSKYGDKIVVFDMAGLEKEKRSGGSTRTSDTSSLNQFATAAVLRCLRVMMHNSNAMRGKSNVVEFTDDDVSEISLVSQAKDPRQRQLRPVPFRQHQITMVLNSLITKSASVKVKILLAVYPGHADIQQKRMLLQDVELLHGSSLLSTLSSVVDTDLKQAFQEENSAGVSETEPPICTNENEFCEANVIPKTNKYDKHREATQANQMNAPIVTRHYTGVTSKATRVEKIESTLSSKPRRVVNRVQPSAPALSEVVTPRGIVCDFPGVDVPHFSADKGVPAGYCQKVTNSTFPTRNEFNSVESGDSNSMETLTVIHNMEAKGTSKHSRTQDAPKALSSALKSPLGRSSLENSTDRQSQNFDSKKIDRVESSITCQAPSAQKNNPFPKSPSYGDSKPLPPFKDTTVKVVSNLPDENPHAEVKRLEQKLRESLQEKHALERVCAQLEKENAELKKEARAAGRKVLQSKWTDQDENEFRDSRRIRREAQNLIKAPVQEHLEKVNYIYEIKNQWCMTNKQHFSLQFPDQFERAPALDLRDKAKKERDDKGEGDPLQILPAQSGDDLVNGRRLSFGASITQSSSASLPEKANSTEPRTALSALKRITARRKSNY